jgi:hypothetical protein
MEEEIENEREAYKKYCRKEQTKMINLNQKATMPKAEEAYRESCERFISKIDHDLNGNSD